MEIGRTEGEGRLAAEVVDEGEGRQRGPDCVATALRVAPPLGVTGTTLNVLSFLS
jgi:hypothetical protein